MKALSYFLIAFVFLASTERQVPGQKAASSEKAYILKYFEKTETDLEREVDKLNKEQMHFKPSAESWSISQCLEHIIATEKMLFQMAKELSEQPENVERKTEIQMSDEALITGITDRTHKFKAPDDLQPAGIYYSPREALKEFKAQRKLILHFITSYDGDLRNHITDSPSGPVDAYQSLIFIAAHTARHTSQIEEVKASKGYPVN